VATDGVTVTVPEALVSLLMTKTTTGEVDDARTAYAFTLALLLTVTGRIALPGALLLNPYSP